MVDRQGRSFAFFWLPVDSSSDYRGQNAMRRFVVLGFAVVAAGVAGLVIREQWEPENRRSGAVAPRPDHWAQPVEIAGAPNFFRVSKDLYRGAQPTEAGMRELGKLGVKTVVNLRSFHSDRDEIGDATFEYEHLWMKPWHPEEKEVVRFLTVVTDPEKTPVFVHCQHGADRTGTMCAIYRIAVQGWTREEAIREMTEGGFGFHEVWQNLVDYIEGLDVETLRVQAGLPVASPSGFPENPRPASAD